MKTPEELKKMNGKDLRKELTKARKAKMALTFEARTGQLAGAHKLRKAKKHIARILTALNELNEEEVKKEVKKAA